MNLEMIETLLQKRNLFLTGGAGVGKTTLTAQIIKQYETNGKRVAKLASTGMAATLLGGQTLHSFFDFGIASSMQELQKSKKLALTKKLRRLINAMDLIVIDEISMVGAELLEMIRFRLLQADFSGRLLVVGDFLQLPPIAKGGIHFAFESESWERFSFETIILEKVYRTNDLQFIKLLHAVRYGMMNETVHNALNEFVKPIGEDLRAFTFLFGRNDSVLRHNAAQLDFLEGDLHVKEANIVVHNEKTTQREIDHFFEDARIEKFLQLKVGAPVLFTRNSWNFFNGERGEIIKIDEDCLYVKKSDASIIKLEKLKQSKTRWIEKENEIVEEELFSVYQYPVRLAFAITIHKSQGMSIEDVIIEPNEVFAPSQFYVALSRAKDPKRLTLIAPHRAWNAFVYAHPKAIDFYKRLQRKPAEEPAVSEEILEF